MTTAVLEAMAIHWRADTGIVPYRLWVALTVEARGRLAVMTQTKAQRMVESIPQPFEGRALDDLIEMSAAP